MQSINQGIEYTNKGIKHLNWKTHAKCGISLTGTIKSLACTWRGQLFGKLNGTKIRSL